MCIGVTKFELEFGNPPTWQLDHDHTVPLIPLISPLKVVAK